MFLLLSRLIDALNEKVANAIGWALLLAVVICAGNALVRYFFHYSSNAWLEIQWYLYAAVFLLASAHTLRRDEHVRLDVVTGRFSRRTQAVIVLFGFLFFLLPVCGLILWYAWPYARLAFTTGEMSMNAGGLVLWPAKILIPAGFLLLVLQGISEVIKRIAFLAGRIGPDAFGKPEGSPESPVPVHAE